MKKPAYTTFIPEELGLHMVEQERPQETLPEEAVSDILPFLREREKISRYELIDLKEIERPLTDISALLRLTNSTSEDEIGHNIILASIATEENQDNKELRKFEALFGRDSLIVSRFLLKHYPELAKTTIKSLAELQGNVEDKKSEEEPGKILHEHRLNGDETRKDLEQISGWKFPYFGSIDATPLFAILVSEYVSLYGDEIFEERVGDIWREKTIEHVYRRALRWVMRKSESNEYGVLAGRRMNPGGIRNQMWKDSEDSYSFSDGSMPDDRSRIASIEVQAYTYDALLSGAEHFKEKDIGFSEQLKKRALEIRKKVLNDFWIQNEDGGYFALGAEITEEREFKLFDVKTSNMGHLLNSRILEGDDPDVIRKREQIIKTLFSEEMLGYWGIRTLSKDEYRFKPGAYHDGGVWPWDNYYIALGLRRHGYHRLAEYLENKILKICETFRKYPEYVSGMDTAQNGLKRRKIWIYDKDSHERIIEEPEQEIQAWTVAAVVAIHKEMADRLKRKFVHEVLPFEKKILLAA